MKGNVAFGYVAVHFTAIGQSESNRTRREEADLPPHIDRQK